MSSLPVNTTGCHSPYLPPLIHTHTPEITVVDTHISYCLGVPVVHDINVFGNIIYNSSSHDIQMVCWGQTFVVPRLSSFVLSDISKVHLLIQNSCE